MGTTLAARPRPGARARAARTWAEIGRRLVREALARHDRREWLVLSLLLHERLTPGEVAAVLGLPPGQVTRTLNRVMSEVTAACEPVRRLQGGARRSSRRGRRSA